MGGGRDALRVVFEVLSPCNRPDEMRRKREFYDRFGVEEYYSYDPDHNTLVGRRRGDEESPLQPIPVMDGWVSPRLGIRFELADPLQIIRLDGRPFQSYSELYQSREAALEEIEANRRSVEEARDREIEARRRAEKLAERLRALGMDPDALD